MVGVLDGVYLLAVVAMAIAGIGLLARTVADNSESEKSQWLEWASFSVVAVFLLALAIEFLA
ncbi:hypothetical protein SAMN04487948_11639 [Halogranum amylolyticum]|uniref:Uncharacterized protein n=1 Tax=Halogranum amylolyticum TaxID=660520 RepID=A0A1H8VFD4_9EURY|nr:hypothetical protein [Halogranum amylolyticum]SEP13917.1 hypothetical protein SAMN04487948_11639 [Halogranum amylolyticum]